MVVGIKDTVKLLGIAVIVCCAVLVCTLFLNYHIDLAAIENEIVTEQMRIMYEALLATAKVVCAVSGGCLLLTSVVMLFFYIKHYIDTHKKELGILKALGYGRWQIARHFWVFGISVLTGALAGFGGALLCMPYFYGTQGVDGPLPEIPLRIHPELLLWLVLVPAVVFSGLSILYAGRKLKQPVLRLLKEQGNLSGSIRQRAGKIRIKGEAREGSFLAELRRSTLREKKVLVFFVIFASFCFSAMTQMSFQMNELSSVMMGVMILLIGLVLACTTLFMAITTVVKGNTRTIALMRVMGYSHRDCVRALLGGYRVMGYVGFAIGSVYQYLLLKIMVSVVFEDVAGMPDYSFDVPVMLLSLGAFVVVYEFVMYWYGERIKKTDLKEIMLE